MTLFFSCYIEFDVWIQGIFILIIFNKEIF